MNDPRFEMTLKSEKGGKPNNMCEALDRIEAKGEKKGEKKGRLAGKKEKALEIAKSLKEKGKLSDSEIAEVTALPLREVAAL